ncbi:hypothetical protein CWATWH0402_5636 [Crocosphaera watsonii WH 0402]|uniref:Uncharacterized protein n=3 Tax=Crocosphaera watsonii TaxID=263511 RepID=T2JIM2_CROWT|nr:hypothetical protein CWATWH0003_3930 [Crocosphaera watsonii WH 0003]CCQ57230.1 hypothetical protein CWATWH0005_2500 [Crocosphaera watsonii WH 0005]CCQ65120.1 hypothetical protein CWATWH0402_5636 [Crocosphaera watsonii WH 0402]
MHSPPYNDVILLLILLAKKYLTVGANGRSPLQMMKCDRS